MKICICCNENKELIDFPKRRNQCKLCIYKKNYCRKINMTPAQERHMKRMTKRRGKPKRIQVAKRKTKHQRLKNTYGFGIIKYNRLLKKQDGKCAICKKVETSVNKKTNKFKDLSVDHCHKTGKIRGLLCSRCNSGLGFFKDDLEIIKNAGLYLEIGG